MAELTYLDPARITATRNTPRPASGTTRTGYGPKLATAWLLLLDGKRWHRLYCMQWSNMGTCYVVVRDERLIVDGSIHLFNAPKVHLPDRDTMEHGRWLWRRNPEAFAR